jgi:6-pyruvoyl-tetrahydropterin synthase
MNAAQVRLQLHQYIDHLDERFLNAMFAMVQQYVDNEEIIGSVGEQTLTKQQLVEEAKTAYNEHKSGKTHTQEAVALEIEKW